MRETTSTINSAIENTSYKINVSATLEPARIFFEEFDSSYPPDGIADGSGVLDEPILQDIGYDTSGSTFVTFYNDGGTLKHQVEGSATLTSDSLSLAGKPGIYGSKLFLVEGTTLKRYDIAFPSVTLSNPSTIDTYTSGSCFVHGVSETECVVFEIVDGGFKAHYHVYDSGWAKYSQSNRFMFPKIARLVGEDETERSMMSYGTFSTALKLGNNIFAYISNAFSGGIDGIVFNPISNSWSDIFIAFPSDINSSLSEFRIANSFVVNNKAFIVGQLMRYEDAEDFSPYTLISSSRDGKIFSIDHFTLVSDLPYRSLAIQGNNYLFMSACNKFCSSQGTYYFLDSDGASPFAISLTDDQMLDFNGNSFRLGVGNEYLLYHEYMKAGSRIIVKLGYKTSNGFEYTTYGTYIISGFSGSIKDGERQLTVNLVSESEWLLSGSNSPFYSEILSKSSLVDPMYEDFYIDPAVNLGIGETEFSVDFWGNKAYSNGDLGITGVYAVDKGGASVVETSGSHKSGIESQELTTFFNITRYPKFKSTSVDLSIYGWSSNRSGSVNDQVGVILFCRSKSDNTDYILYQAPSKRFPNTYLTSVSGDEPIEYTISGCTIDDELIKVGLVFEASSSTVFTPVRVDFTSGVLKMVDPLNRNTSWTFTSGSGYELPGSVFPYISTSRKPYNAFNFMIGGKFIDTVTGYISGYPCSFGLAGLIFDGANYIAARYNKTNDQLEIVKVLDNIETIITSGSHMSTIGTECDIMFVHKDGHFEIYIKESGVWTKNLEYDWQDSDGYLFKDTIASMKVGIYGYIAMPYFYTSGVSVSSDEDVENCEGIPIMPGISQDILDDFPSSGKCQIEDRKYLYSSKIKPDIIRGPFQFRQSGDGTKGQYVEPYGDGTAGLECLDFNWTMTDGTYTGKLIAIDDGFSYIATNTKWQIWITTNGSVIYLLNRARYLASGSSIGDYYHDLSNRVYMTGGLISPNLIEGEYARHGFQSMATACYEGSIWCRSFFGSSGDIDATIEDLIDKVSKTSNAKAIFPGDTLFDEIVLTSGNPSKIETDNLVDGFDVRFSFETISTGNYVDLVSDTQLRGYTQEKSILRIKKISNGNYQAILLASTPESIYDNCSFEMPDTAHSARILYHDNFATLYIDDIWIYTFGVSVIKNSEDPLRNVNGITYSPTLELYLETDMATLTISDIRVCELSDWREAIYIPMETDGMSAIQSIIQERPIEIVQKSNGSISYCYEPIRSIINQKADNIRSHAFQEKYPMDGASDAIIYYADVKTIQHSPFIKKFGLSTRTINLPNLNVGALKAAKIMLQRNYERSKMHDLSVRQDIRIEVGDILYVHYYASGTKRESEFYIIIEDVSLGVANNSSMRIVGREIEYE
jgi:hypothetical protein